jgi:hypothetical protein
MLVWAWYRLLDIILVLFHIGQALAHAGHSCAQTLGMCLPPQAWEGLHLIQFPHQHEGRDSQGGSPYEEGGLQLFRYSGLL